MHVQCRRHHITCGVKTAHTSLYSKLLNQPSSNTYVQNLLIIVVLLCFHRNLLRYCKVVKDFLLASGLGIIAIVHSRSVVAEVDSGTNASLDCKFFTCLWR